MSLERVLRLLEDFGFSRVDSEVYLCLAKNGPKKSRDLTVCLKMTKQQLYPILKCLQEKGVVSRTPPRPALFTALSFEELLNLIIRVNLEQASAVRETRKELLDSWRNMAKQNNT